MRETKFRVYCEFTLDGEVHKSMETEESWFLLTQAGKILVYGPMEEPRAPEKEYTKLIPLFYTGLKDKDGKEIYEGDIVKISNVRIYDGRIGTIRYANKWASFYVGTKNEHGVGIALDSVHQWYYNDNDGTDCEVIGNIYENPELLGK